MKQLEKYTFVERHGPQGEGLAFSAVVNHLKGYDRFLNSVSITDVRDVEQWKTYLAFLQQYAQTRELDNERLHSFIRLIGEMTLVKEEDTLLFVKKPKPYLVTERATIPLVYNAPRPQVSLLNCLGAWLIQKQRDRSLTAFKLWVAIYAYCCLVKHYPGKLFSFQKLMFAGSLPLFLSISNQCVSSFFSQSWLHDTVKPTSKLDGEAMLGNLEQ